MRFEIDTAVFLGAPVAVAHSVVLGHGLAGLGFVAVYVLGTVKPGTQRETTEVKTPLKGAVFVYAFYI